MVQRLPSALHWPLCFLPAGVVLLLAHPAVTHADFTDVSDAAALTFSDVTYGLGWGDFDRDGAPDLHIVRHYFRPIVYRNVGPDQFNHSFSPPLFDAQDHHGPLIADFDHDGDLDIYITGGADGGSGNVAKRFYRNDGSFMFTDVASAAGVADTLARGRSGSAIDLEGDGDVDFFVAKAPRVDSANALFRQDGPMIFSDVAAAAGVDDAFGSVGGAWGDYDRDGDPDLLIGGEEQATYETRLYRNDGGTFTDVTASALPGVGQITSADWGDYDQDGDLDLVLGVGEEGLFDAVTSDADSITFFFNTRFGDDGVDGFGFTQTGDSASFDLYINGFYNSELVFIADDGHHPGFQSPFVVGSDILGAPNFLPGQSIGFFLWTSGINGIWEMRTSAPPGAGHTFAGRVRMVNGEIAQLGLVALEPYTTGVQGTRIYRNDGGSFIDVTASAGITDRANVRFAKWVDIDLDGFLDLYVLSKGDTEVFNQPNIFYRSLGNGAFVDDTGSQSLEGDSEGLADACAFEDYDGDGDLDVAIVSGTGPRYFALRARHRLYRNDGPTGNHLRVDLKGSTSTSDGYGAWVTCSSPTAGRQSHYVTGNAWRGSQQMIDPYFGLGADTVVDSLVVQWPSGIVTVVMGVPAGTVTVPEAGSLDAPALARVIPDLAITVGPNPTLDRGRLTFAGRRSVPATLAIYDAAGRRVFGRDVPPDVDHVEWNGRDAAGGRVAPGVYFARLHEGPRSASVKIVIVGQSSR